METHTYKEKAEAVVKMYQELLNSNLIDNKLTAKEYAIQTMEICKSLSNEREWDLVKKEINKLA